MDTTIEETKYKSDIRPVYSFLSPRPWCSPKKHTLIKASGVVDSIGSKFYRSKKVSDETTINGGITTLPNLHRPSTTRNISCGSTESFDSDNSDSGSHCSHPDLVARSSSCRLQRSFNVISKPSNSNSVNIPNGFDNCSIDNKQLISLNASPPGAVSRPINERPSPAVVNERQALTPTDRIKFNSSSENLNDAEDTERISAKSKTILTDFVRRNSGSPEKDRLKNGKVKSLYRSRLTRIVEVDGITYRVTMEPPDDPSEPSEKINLLQDREGKNPQGLSTLSVNLRGRFPKQISGERSASLNEAELKERLVRARVRSSSCGAEAKMTMQAPGWNSQREKLASEIDVSKPIHFPASEENIQENGSAEDANIVPDVQSREALNHAALRLRRLTQTLGNGKVVPQVWQDSLKYAISVLEMKFFLSESDEEEVLESDVIVPLPGESVVPPEIKRWLMLTFSTSGMGGALRKTGERRTLRSVVHAMQAGMFVERMFRKASAATSLNVSPEIQNHLKVIEKWSFDVFELNRISDGNALKFVFHELLLKYNFLRKFKISSKTLFSYCDRLQAGYTKHNNQYHNPVHAADVAQCVSCFLNESGFLNWLTDLEVFAMLFAAIIHDVEHTGTTNNFHTQTRSNLALLYNDRSVLENHHVSSAFRILWEDSECDILSQMSKEDYSEFRALVIEMVLATDMSRHFGQIKNMKAMVQHPESLERSKAMCMMLHCADINHPSRPWELHHRWTENLMQEFFEQGDKERELNLPLSPLCDRHSTMLAQSQIGFIDYVIRPTFDVLGDLFMKVSKFILDDGKDEDSGGSSNRKINIKTKEDCLTRRFSDASPVSNNIRNQALIIKTISNFRENCTNNINCNRKNWLERDKIEQADKIKKENDKEPEQSNGELSAET